MGTRAGRGRRALGAATAVTGSPAASGSRVAGSTTAASTRLVRGGAKQALSVAFAITATFGIVLVNFVDPTATATGDYRADERFGGRDVQALDVAGVAAGGLTVENYVVETKKPTAPAAASPGWAPPAVTPNPGSAQAYAAGAVAARGWPASEFDCLVALWGKESGWRVNAYNASSGAYGIPQALPGTKMASAGTDWETSAATQIEWGLGYVGGRYGSPCGAWAHSQDVGWY